MVTAETGQPCKGSAAPARLHHTTRHLRPRPRRHGHRQLRPNRDRPRGPHRPTHTPERVSFSCRRQPAQPCAGRVRVEPARLEHRITPDPLRTNWSDDALTAVHAWPTPAPIRCPPSGQRWLAGRGDMGITTLVAVTTYRPDGCGSTSLMRSIPSALAPRTRAAQPEPASVQTPGGPPRADRRGSHRPP
jgi:hypothetical protein